MEEMSVTCQDQGPVNPQDDLATESQVQSEVASNTDSNSPLQDREAPRADPEEEIDTLQPETDAVTTTDNQESACMGLDTTEETQEMVKEEVSPPSPPDTTVPKDDAQEKEGLSGQEVDQGESSSDFQSIEDLTQDQECQEPPQTPSLTEPLDKDIDTSSGDLIDNNLTTNCSADGLNNNKAEDNIQEPAAVGITSAPHDSPSDKNNLDDVHTTCPPPSADESEEEKEVSVEITPCQQQQQPTKSDLKQKLLQSLASAKLSTVNPPAVTLAKLREELLIQIRREIALRGANQETAQQVLSQALPPLTTVTMELSNEGGAASSQHSGYVEAGRETQNRVEEKTDGESTQTGEEEEPTEGGLDRDKAIGKQRSGGLHFTKAVQTRKPKPKRYRFLSSKQTRMESDDSQSDSGVSADFSPCSTLDANTTTSPGAVAPVPKETPIEREIRRAIEREHSLRRSRGLPNQPTLPEYVEIPLKKTVLFQPQATTAEKIQSKDKQFAGKKMQHEIHEEVQREQDLVKLGKVPGFYHKGTVRQLKERKKLFEAFQAPAASPLPPPARSRARSWPFSSTSDISNLVNQDTSTMRHTSKERSPSSVKGGGLTSSAPRGPGLSEGTGCQVIIIENSLSASAQNLYSAKPKAEVSPAVDFARPSIPPCRTEGHNGIKVSGQEKEKEEEGELTPKENPFFKLRTSTNLVKVEQDIREAQERERELHRQRVNLYGDGGGGRGGRPANIERRNTKLTRSSSLNRVPEIHSTSSSSRPMTGPPAVRQSVGKLGMWPPAQAEEEKISRPEILLSPRKRTPLVQRWEAGLINGHNQDDN
ncbi:uncharacterized protein misp3 [Xyrichtys novacula]|uniref:Uncharacterized protein misp3 n=1 Tax=Xyrichtys novacula TaxID=13765 RepID=A0AAV1EXU3_XYRNO|nr:uncharacterized protein misp3 [Xyrichtys novacula]